MDIVGGLNGTQQAVRIVDYKCGRYDAGKMSATTDDLRKPESPDADYVRQTLLYSHVVYMQSNHKSQIEPHLYFTSQDLTNSRTLTRVSIDKSPITYCSSNHEQYAALIRGMVEDIVGEREFAQCEKCSPYCPFLRLCGRKAQKY